MVKVKEVATAWPNIVNNLESLESYCLPHNLSLSDSFQTNDSIMSDLERDVLLSQLILDPVEDSLTGLRPPQYLELLGASSDLLSGQSSRSVIGLSNEQLDIELPPVSDFQQLQHMMQSPASSIPSTPCSPFSSPSFSTSSSPASSFEVEQLQYQPPHFYPPQPHTSVMPQQLNFYNSSLTPLSCGGFIFNQGNTHLPPQTPFVTPFVPVQPGHSPFTATVTPVSSEIASRQAKLDKFRQKRSKRNPNRIETKSQRALSRPRDEFGKFVSDKDSALVDVKSMLERSQEESALLKHKLMMMELEMALLRQRAEQATVSNEVIMQELAAQKTMNTSLLQENRLLWTSVPSHEVFCTVKQIGPATSKTPSHYLNVKPFEQKIDLSLAAQDLTNTDSRILEAAIEEADYEKRWDALTFTPGGAC